MQDNNDSLSVINERYKGCNLLMPMSTSEQMSPFYKMTVMEVKADLSENSGDVFKVGNVKVGSETRTNREGEKYEKGIYEDVYSPAKPLLMKIAAAAGIQFDPSHTGGEYVSGDKNVYRGRAYGAMKMPDGTWKTHADEKIINLHDSEDNYRLEFMDKSLKGITDERQAKAAAEMFEGTWKPAKNKYGKEVQAYFVAEKDREKYIERGVMVNMTLLRKTMCEKALTGAILRTVRALTGLKGTYTKKELSKPFAIPRVTFSPDYSDPQIRAALLNQEIGSTAALFGSAPAAAAPVLQDSLPTAPEKAFDVDAFATNPAFASDLPDPSSEEQDGEHIPSSASEQPPAQSNKNENPEDNYICEVCGAIISAKVYDYSVNKYGRPLCVKCQRGVR
jgi:hypothetical protein